jgi:hypothetical protein
MYTRRENRRGKQNSRRTVRLGINENHVFWVKRNNLFLEQLGVFGKEDLARFISEH